MFDRDYDDRVSAEEYRWERDAPLRWEYEDMMKSEAADAAYEAERYEKTHLTQDEQDWLVESVWCDGNDWVASMAAGDEFITIETPDGRTIKYMRVDEYPWESFYGSDDLTGNFDGGRVEEL